MSIRQNTKMLVQFALTRALYDQIRPISHPFYFFPFPKIIKNIKTQNVLDHGVLVHVGARARARASYPQPWRSCAPWCARARPHESSPTMHGVLVHRGARPRARARARPRESSPTMAFLCTMARACARARVVPNHGVLVHRDARTRVRAQGGFTPPKVN